MSDTFKPPASVAKEAKKGLEYHDKNPDAATRVGLARANQLADREEVSLETVKRMRAFFDRHEKNKSISPEHKEEPWKDNGHTSWLLWGGDSGREWAEEVLKGLKESKMSKLQTVLNELGKGTDAKKAMSRMKRMLSRDMGAREVIFWLVANYTQDVIDTALPQMEKDLEARAKEEYKLFKSLFSEVTRQSK